MPEPEVIDAVPTRTEANHLVVRATAPQPIDPLALVERAIEKGVDVAQLQGLVDLARQMKQDAAAEQFALALASYQAEVPTVFKRRTAKIKTSGGGEYSYGFASYDDVMRVAGPVLAKHKIAVSFSTEQVQNMLKVVCRIRVGTHFEDHPFTVPIPAMSVNDTQKFGAALAYAKRYAFCAATNTVVTDEDTDAEALVDTITEGQAKELDALMVKKGVNVAKFLRWADISPWAGAADKDLPKAPEFPVDALLRMPVGTLAKAFDELRRKPDVKR
jgi:hypothetical protein